MINNSNFLEIQRCINIFSNKIFELTKKYIKVYRLDLALGRYEKCPYKFGVVPGFKNKPIYTSYVSPRSQISHIVINKSNIERQCSIYNILSIKDITLDSKQRKRQLRSSSEDSKSTGTTDWLTTSLIPPNSINLVPIRDFFPNM